MVGDLAGFVASIYKRGIAYVQVPTTLLAQVDSAIGGKTAVDLGLGKNLAGAFYQPKLVFSDTAILRTLDVRQILSGLAEIIKYAAIKDPALLGFLEKKHTMIIRKDIRSLESIIRRSSSIKAKIVQIDEREERGIRTALNFGHTIGHAIETAGKYKRYNHGEAIALGMLVALDIGRAMGYTDRNTQERIERLIRTVGLPTRINKIAPADIIKAHYFDKKFSGAKNRFVIVGKIGRVIIKKGIPLSVIQASLKKFSR